MMSRTGEREILEVLKKIEVNTRPRECLIERLLRRILKLFKRR